jgi:hypothetical protein
MTSDGTPILEFSLPVPTEAGRVLIVRIANVYGDAPRMLVSQQLENGHLVWVDAKDLEPGRVGPAPLAKPQPEKLDVRFKLLTTEPIVTMHRTGSGPPIDGDEVLIVNRGDDSIQLASGFQIGNVPTDILHPIILGANCAVSLVYSAEKGRYQQPKGKAV